MANGGYVNDITVVSTLRSIAMGFQNEVVDFSIIMRNSVASLNGSWNDSQFYQFQDFIDDLTKQLQNDTNVIDKAIDSLEREILEG